MEGKEFDLATRFIELAAQVNTKMPCCGCCIVGSE
jgi:hypothetical protein